MYKRVNEFVRSVMTVRGVFGCVVVPVLHVNWHDVILLAKAAGFGWGRLQLEALKCCHDLPNLFCLFIYLLPNLDETHKHKGQLQQVESINSLNHRLEELQPAAISAVERSL